MPISRCSMQVNQILAIVERKMVQQGLPRSFGINLVGTSEDLERKQPFVRYIFDRISR